MPFEIVRNDITNMRVDAIVNTANPRPVIGLGVDSAIHEKAGPELLAARQKIGSIACGSAAITPAFDLDAKYVIHTVGPVWNGGSYGEETLLRNCYDNALNLALEHNCQSIAFPLISTGNYGFPIEGQFGYDLSRTCDKIRPNYHHVESCQETIPEAITAFLEGESFEDVIRTAVSLGGDCDTLTCIAGAIAEGFYGVPEDLKQECRNHLPEHLLEVLQKFDSFLNR